jgi:hypothetical protein
MLTVSTCFWDVNEGSESFSRCYDQTWVEKLYRGFKRNLTIPFRFVCFTDRIRTYREPVEQELLERRPITYGSCVEPFKLNEPMIFVGLDTVITGNIDKMARWCIQGKGKKLALPKHPFEEFSINGVVLVGAGQRHIFDTWRGENDMKWMRSFPHDRIDELWKDRVVSYRAHVRGKALNKARIVYFHGREKMHEIPHVPWIKECWR